VNRWIYIALYLKPFICKALSYGPCVTTGSHSFTCHWHTNHTCLYFPACKASPPFGWYSLCTKGWPGWVDLDGCSHNGVCLVIVFVVFCILCCHARDPLCYCAFASNFPLKACCSQAVCSCVHLSMCDQMIKLCEHILQTAG